MLLTAFVPPSQVILEEGSTVPADGRILCNYDEREKVDVHDRLQKIEQAKKGQTGGKKGHDDDDDDDKDVVKQIRGPSVLAVDQSAITGESLAVDKFVGETAFYTCGVKRGKVVAVVSAPAKQSFVGKTAALVTGSNEEGHFKKVLDGIGTALLVLVALTIFIMVIGMFFRGVRLALPAQNNILVYA